VDLDLVTSQLYFNSDYHASVEANAPNNVVFTDGRLITAQTLMTLEAATNAAAAGKLTLQAGSGVVLLDSLRGMNTNKALVINADYDSAGDGTLTVTTLKVINSNKSDITITAWDIDLDGVLSSGTLTISIHGSKDMQTIGVGGTSQDMHIVDLELQRMLSSGGMRLGGSAGGTIRVNGITTDGSNNVAPLITMTARGDNAQVIFSSVASTFNGISAQADNGIMVQVDATTDMSHMILDVTWTILPTPTITTRSRPTDTGLFRQKHSSHLMVQHQESCANGMAP
jgi:hypothetical protein